MVRDIVGHDGQLWKGAELRSAVVKVMESGGSAGLDLRRYFGRRMASLLFRVRR